MVLLNFTLSPASCVRFYDALNCLSRFSDLVCLEARNGQLALSSLNSSKSAYALFVYSKNEFFWDYDFEHDDGQLDTRYSCQFVNKALASIFKGRAPDSQGGEGAIERCQATFEDTPDRAKCRFIVKMYSKQGVTKTYTLTYESVEMMQAVFNKSRASNRWQIQARILRDLSEHFAPKTEQLDIYAEEGNVTLTSYTEKVVHGREVLKQPLQTAVTIKTVDFEEFNAQELIHIGINVKDFRNIVTHADSLKATLTALYSHPTQPLQLSYSGEGMRCEFTLMTIGDFRGSSADAAVTRLPTREPTRHASSLNGASTRAAPESAMAPQQMAPRSTTRSRQSRTLGSRSAPSQTRTMPDPDSDSLFFQAGDDDQLWGTTDEREDGDGYVGWDASADHDGVFRPTFSNDLSRSNEASSDNNAQTSEEGLPPTQRASQVRGIFD